MKMDLEALAKVLEEQIPNVITICVPEINQIVATFVDRPDVEIALLTPSYQTKIIRNGLESIGLSQNICSMLLYFYIQEGQYPKHIRASGNVVFFYISDITQKQTCIHYVDF